LTVSEVVRERLEEFLRTEPSSPRSQIRDRAAALSGRFRSGVSDLSIEHDRYLEESFSD
jgi:hypothetical protein